jgi:cytochrome c oxidase subunit II
MPARAVRGTPVQGRLSPDLTQVGSWLSRGAGLLPHEPPVFRYWLAQTNQVKPGVLMPALGMLRRDWVRSSAT